MQSGGVVGIVGGQHTGGCDGGLAHGASCIEDGDRGAASVEFQGQGESNQAGTSDGNVIGWLRDHQGIV